MGRSALFATKNSAGAVRVSEAQIAQGRGAGLQAVARSEVVERQQGGDERDLERQERLTRICKPQGGPHVPPVPFPPAPCMPSLLTWNFAGSAESRLLLTLYYGRMPRLLGGVCPSGDGEEGCRA